MSYSVKDFSGTQTYFTTASGTGVVGDPYVHTSAITGSVAVTGTFWQATQPVSLTSTTITGSVAVTGTFWQATQPISAASLPLPSGAATEATLGTTNAEIGATNESSAAADNSTSGLNGLLKRVLARLTALLPTALGAGGGLKVDGSGTALPVSGTVAVTGTFWQATQPVSLTSTTITGTVTVGAHAVTNAGTFAVQVDGTGLTRLTDIETNTDSGAVVGNGAAATAQRVTLANDSTGIVALTTSTASIGKLAANSGVDIGDVDVTSAIISSGTLTTCTTLTGGGIAHDSADSGNPHKIGAVATASVLGDTPVAAADRTNLKAGLDGVLIERPHTSLEDIISEVKTNTDGASTAMTGGFAATASQRIYLTSLIIANSSSTNITVDIRDGSAGSVLATFPVPANGGCIHAFPVPLRFTANTAAAFDGSAAATTLSVTMVGFKSKQ